MYKQEEIIARIKREMYKKDITQKALAVDMKCSISEVSRILLGRSKMYLSTFIKLCKALDASSDDLLGL